MYTVFSISLYIYILYGRLHQNRQANSFLIPFKYARRPSVNKKTKKKKPFLRSPADDDLTAIRRIFKSSRVVFILASRRHNMHNIRHAH